MNKKIYWIGGGVLAAAVVFYLIGRNTAPVPAPPSPDGDATKGLVYSSLADQVYNAMNGWGTDENVIYNVFSQLNSQYDFDSLSTAYGTRVLSSGFLNPFGGYTGGLSDSVKRELSNSQLAQANSLLFKKGIKTL